MERRYRCYKCGSPDSLEMLEEVKEVVYECKDKSNPEEPGDVMKISFVCKGGCLEGGEDDSSEY